MRPCVGSDLSSRMACFRDLARHQPVNRVTAVHARPLDRTCQVHQTSNLIKRKDEPCSTYSSRLSSSVLASPALARKRPNSSLTKLRRAKLSEQESKEFQAELAGRTEQARQELDAEIDRRIDHAFIQLGIVKAGVKKEYEAAKAELRTAIDAQVEQVLKRLGVARADDVQALAIRLERPGKKAGRQIDGSRGNEDRARAQVY